MNSISYQSKAKPKDDKVLRLAKFIFAFSLAMLLICVAIFSGAALGNTDIANTVLENEEAANLQTAEAGGATGGTNTVAWTISTLGTKVDFTTGCSTGNVFWSRYWDGNDHGNTNYFGNGVYGNGGTGTVRQKNRNSSASTNFRLSGYPANLQQKGLLRVTISATVRSKNGYDGQRKVGYRKGGSLMAVDTSSTLLNYFTTIASRNTNGADQTQRGTVTFDLGVGDTTICIGVGGNTNYTGWIGGRYPGQQVEDIDFTLTSLDTTTPSFVNPSISSWVADNRSVTYTINENVELVSSQAYLSNGTAVATSLYKPSLTQWTATFTANYANSYYVQATDSTGRVGQSATWNYVNYRIDGYAPKVLNVLFVRSTAPSVLVTNGLSPGTGTPWSGDAKCYIEVEDFQSTSKYTSGTIYSSGIKSVTFAGNACTLVPAGTVLPGGITTAVVNTYHGATGKAWYLCNINITENMENAKVVVTDNVNKTSGEINASIYHLDKVAPVVESAVVTSPIGTLTTANANNWFNGPATLTLTIVDYATTSNTLSLARDRAAGLNNITLTGTRYTRNGTNTAGSTQYPISASFNPSTTAASATYPDNVTPYMTRTSYVATTCVVGGVTYYCYRSVITVPIWYRSNYSFSIKDNAGNATTQFKYNHTTGPIALYKPNIDETAPSFSSVNVIADGGNPKLQYVNSKYLEFQVSASDQDSGGRNDGSGIKTIQLWANGFLVSKYEAATPYQTGAAKSLFVYDTTFTGTVDTNSFIQKIDINSCTRASYNIVIIDAAGNSTTMSPSTGTNSMQINPNGTTVINQPVFVDNITPTVTVKGGGVALQPSTATYSGDTTTRVYEYPWTATSQSISIDYTFGCSGATLYQYNNTLLDSGRVQAATWGAAGSQNRNTNSKTWSTTYSNEGINYYSFKLINGSSVTVGGTGYVDLDTGLPEDTAGASYTLIVIKVKVDKTAPTYELLGFGSSITVAGKTDIASIKSSIISPLGATKITENLLTTTNSYYGASFKAYYYIKDPFAGVADNKAGTSWLIGGSAKAHVTVKHGNYSYSYTVNYDTASNTNFTILTVEMYNLNTLKLMTNGGTPIWNSANDTYNLTYGTNVIYNINIKDNVGNTGSVMGGDDCVPLQNKTDLSYNVDPFPIAQSAILTPKDTTYNYDYFGQYKDAIESGWTSLDIRYTITKQTSISPVVCQYRLIPMSDIDDFGIPKTPTEIGTPEQVAAIGWTDVGDLGSANTASFILSTIDGSRCAFVEFRIYKSYVTYGGSNSEDKEVQFKDDQNQMQKFIIKQDVDTPIITAVFFSRNGGLAITSQAQALANSEILAYFKANFDGNNYTYTRLTSNTNVWTFEQSYMYVIATDSRGTGSGAGVKTVTLYNHTGAYANAYYVCNANTLGGNYTGEQLFRSASANFGYLDATNTNAISFKLLDYAPQANETSLKSITTDTAGGRVLPRVEIQNIAISMISALYGTTSPRSSYISGGRLKGTSISQSLDITFSYSWGVSGASVYRVDKPEFFATAYNSAATDPWGFGSGYLGTTKTATSPTQLTGLFNVNNIAGLTEITALRRVAGASGTASYTYTISNLNETKSRYYFLIVSNVNEYAGYRPIGYLVAGDVFIDTTPPTFDDYKYVSSVTGNQMDIATVYTNDSVTAYLKASDGASGIYNVYLKSGSVANTKDVYTLRPDLALTLETAGTYAGYYKYTMTEKNDFYFIAFDNTGNFTVTNLISPLIDKVPPQIVINTKKADNSSYDHTKANNFTNSPYIQANVKVTTGISGFYRLRYSIDGGVSYYPISNLLDKDGNPVTITTNGDGSKSAIFNIDENYQYRFIAENNILAMYSKDGQVPKATGVMNIAIDTVKPSLNESNANYLAIKGNWHNTPQNLVLDASDNVGGSGIDEIRVRYTSRIDGLMHDAFFKYNSETGKFETYTLNGENIVFGGDFALSEFITYNITIVDIAGNISANYTIRPALDTYAPNFSSTFTMATVDGAYTGGTTLNANWTKNDVNITLSPIFTMSGAIVQVATKENTLGAQWSGWTTIKDLLWDKAFASIPDSDAGVYDTVGNNFVYTVMPIELRKSVNAYYKFRIVSGAGLEYIDTNEVLIQIDQEKPEFANTTKISDLNLNGFGNISLPTFTTTEDAHTYTFGATSWSSAGVRITSAISATPASGATLQFALYNVSQGKWNDWSAATNPYEIRNDTAGITIKFRYISGSQIASKEVIINAIKIDKQLPKVTLIGRTSFAGTTNEDGSFAPADKSYFVNGGIYNTTWTNARYIVLNVNASFGYSGARLTFQKDGTHIPQNDISISYGESGELYYFIPYTVGLTVNIVSGSGLTGYAEKSINIDNLLPELYITEISGTKSTNWDGTEANSYFTSSTYFNFGVGTYKNKTGTLERNTDGSGNAIPSPSGFVIEYRTKTLTGYTDWTAVSSTTAHDIVTMDVVEGRIYRFRIRSNSGMVNELGQDIVYNGQVVATTAAVDANVLQYHTNAMFKHLATNKYDYLINMDKNTYYITSSQNIKYYDGANVQNSYSTSYAQYVYEIFVDDAWVLTSVYRPGKDYEYKHGDLIRLTYQANYTSGKYLHRYTDYIEYYETEADGVTTRTVISSNTFTANTAQEEKAGAIQFRFTKHDYSVEAYFKQEITATHTNKVAYVQSYRQVSNPTFASNIELKYYYTVDGILYNIPLGVTLSYKNMLTNEVQDGSISVASNSAMGGYLITAQLDHEVNRQSFIITNPNDILLVKYFTVDGTNPYTIADQNDLEMIKSSYYDSYHPTALILNAPKSYLGGDFKQTADINLTQGYEPIADFAGTYDGNGKTITFADTVTANGDFGLFTSIIGTAGDYASVSNLAIQLNRLVVYDAQNVGILAGSMAYVEVNNIWINAEMVIDSTSESGANIGGLAGETTFAKIGGVSSNYIDVRMLHNGNVLGNDMSENTAVGGVIGYAKTRTYLFNTYNFGGMEIYGVESAISTGAVIGTLAQYVTLANKDNFFGNNYYLSGNVFTNDNLITDFIGTDNSVSPVVTASNLTYSDFVVLTDLVVGRTIKDSVLRKLYQDFGMEVTFDGTNYVYSNGLGTLDNKLQIGSVSHIETINKYVMLNYQLLGDIDMAGFDQSIAAHKVFTGILEGKNGTDAVLTNFAGEIYEGYYGLFANFDGTIRNIVFEDLKVDITYTGADTLYIGLVAGKSYQNADINNIISIGRIEIDAPNSDVVAGGLVGQSYYGNIYNIFNMANIKLSAKETSLGGIIGASNNTVLAKYNEVSDAIFSLARVEGNHTGFGDVGAIVGSGSVLDAISDMSKVFGLEDNTYSNGSITNRTVGSSSVNNATLTTFANSAMRSISVSDGNLFTEVFVTRNLYPLQGVSASLSSTVGADLDNPFKITNEEDFKYINNALYAYYRIVAPDNKINFASFETIGEGLFFTGRIDGKTAASGSAEEGEVVSLDGVSDSLVYYNKGTISDLSVNVNYTKNLTQDQNADFGAIAKYNKGTIRNVIVSGDITLNGGNSVTASGFVGIDYGGVIDNSSIKNSISSVDITVRGANTVYIGGYIGKIIGATTVSFAIGQGNIYIEDCPSYYAGWLIGSIEGNLDINLSLIKNYAYTINATYDGQTTTTVSDLTNYTGLHRGN